MVRKRLFKRNQKDILQISISGDRAGLRQLKSMFSQIYDDFHRRLETDNTNSIEEDIILRYKLSKSVPSTTEMDISKDLKPLWKKFVGNV